MKSLPKFLSLLAVSSMMVGCNEKIAPELQGSNSTTIPGPTTSTTTDYVFKLEQTSPLLLRYKMHKTGEGNNDAECKIEESSFSTSNFKTQQSTYDITCYVEAEEQSLFYNGLDLKLTASANLCENVVYAPYNFFQYQPGSSTRSVNLYRCADEINGDMSGTYQGTDPTATFPQAACDTALEPGLLGSAAARSIEDDQDLCDFDYTESEGPNCDSGIISISETTISLGDPYCTNGVSTSEAECLNPTAATPPAVTPPAGTWVDTELKASVPTTRIHKCSGKIANCRAGVGISNIQSTFKGLIAEVNPSQTDEIFEKEITLDAPNSKGYFTNMGISNFVRQCSGSIDNSDPAYFSTAALSSTSATERKKFDPNVLDRYSIGIKYWTGATVDNYYSSKSSYTTYHTPRSTASSNVDTSLGWTKTNYAADSFMSTISGISSMGSIQMASANPFYAFYCLNNALDIKARIRLVVREWDQFPDYDGQDFEMLSDIYHQPTATPENGLMDTTGIEVEEDSNPFNDLNDVWDWDDFLRDTTADLVPGPNRAMDEKCSGPAVGSEDWYSPNRFPGSSL